MGIPLAEVDIPSATDDEDDEDGGRTVMRESPNVSEIFRSPAAAPAPSAAWSPAMPPAHGSSSAHAAVQQPGARPFPERSPSGPMAPGPPMGPSPLGGLIQETIENLSPGGGTTPPPGPFPSETPSLGGGMPAASPSTPGGPFAPLGGGGGFAPAPWAQQGNEVSGSFALGQGPSTPQPAQPFQPAPFGPPAGGLPGLAPPAFGQAPAFGAPGAAAAPAYPVGGAAAAIEPASAPRRSKKGLFVVCFLVLILAAAVTFSVLRFRPQLGF